LLSVVAATLTLACSATGLPPLYVAPNGSGAVLSPWLPGADEIALPVGSMEVSPPIRAQVLNLLAEYEAAYQARDIERLGRVWVMDAYERFVMAGLFRSYEQLSMSLKPGDVRSSGSTVLVDFVQRTARLSGSRGGAQLRAALARRNSGEWVVYEVWDRPEEALPAGTAKPDRGAAAATREFEAAFEAKDMDRLSAIWMMSEGEQEKLEKVFRRSSGTRFQIDLVALSTEGRHATFDFDQLFVSRTRRPGDSAIDRLRAQLSRDDDGDWVISRLVSRSR